MPTDFNWELLDRFFAGECTPAERADVLHWLETHTSLDTWTFELDLRPWTETW